MSSVIKQSKINFTCCHPALNSIHLIDLSSHETLWTVRATSFKPFNVTRTHTYTHAHHKNVQLHLCAVTIFNRINHTLVSLRDLSLSIIEKYIQIYLYSVSGQPSSILFEKEPFPNIFSGCVQFQYLRRFYKAIAIIGYKPSTMKIQYMSKIKAEIITSN